MERIAVVTDTNSGLTKEEAKRAGICVLPMTFMVAGREHKEGITLTDKEFFASLDNGDEVSTTQLSIAELKEVWDALLEDYDRIIYIPMSRALSGSYQTAAVFSQEYEGRVLVADCRRISVTQASAAIYARKLVDAGMNAEEIVNKLEEAALDAGIYIMVESLDYLRKGGRISGATAIAGELLNIKPILQIKGDLLEIYGKIRGHNKAKRMMEKAIEKDYERLAAKYGAEGLELYVGHANAEKEVREWAERFRELYPDNPVMIAKLPMSICCHVGSGTIGAAVCAN